MKKGLKVLVLVVILFLGLNNVSNAQEAAESILPTVPNIEESPTVGLTIRSSDTIIFSNTVSLQATGTININDSSGVSHPVDARSVLSVMNDADLGDSSWNISDLQYFDSFSSFYLKCITSPAGENCDNWQYTVNGSYASSGIDQTILSGGENVYVYFGPQNRLILSSSSLTENETLTVTTQEYDYEDNTWANRNGVTVGLTQPNPDDPFNPIEVLTSAVDDDGQATFTDIPTGSYNVGVREDFYFPTEPLAVIDAPEEPPTSGGGGGSRTQTSITVVPGKSNFNLKKAFEFLNMNQKEDGSFGEELYTDWATIALVTNNYQEGLPKLIKYFTNLKIENYRLTDYERHAMALLALGLNPYNTNGVNYIEKITSSFDGKQFGDPIENNDDIFALMVLQNTGFTVADKMIKDDIDFILSKQQENGSWNESVDMTGAGIQALAPFAEENSLLWGVSQADEPRGSAESTDSDSDPKVKRLSSAIQKAKEFLKQSQKDHGGWDNVSATAWATQGILALKEKPEDWKKSDPLKKDTTNTPFDYLASNQDTDGGIKNTSTDEEQKIKNKIWETAYVTTAYSGKTWNEIMQKFEKPKDAGNVLGASTESKITSVTKKPTPKLKPKSKITKSKPEIVTPANTATAVNADLENNTPIPTASEKPNWIVRFLKFIF